MNIGVHVFFQISLLIFSGIPWNGIVDLYGSSIFHFWRNVCWGLFPTFWLGCLFFWYWVVWTACIFWKLILCQLFHLLLFSPILKVFFHLAYSFLCCVKAFKFNQVPLACFVFISVTLGSRHRGSCCDLCHWVFCLCFPLRVL